MGGVNRADISHNQCHLGEDGSVSDNVNVKRYNDKEFSLYISMQCWYNYN